MQNAVGSHCPSLTLFMCLPLSQLVYRCMILIILMFVGGTEVEGNYARIVVGNEMMQVLKCTSCSLATFTLFFRSTFFNHPNNTRSEYN